MNSKFFKIRGVRYNLDCISTYWARGNQVFIQTKNHVGDDCDGHTVDIVDRYLKVLDSMTACIDVEKVKVLGEK
ncbi:hypothetical protein PQE20_27370 (plasmid) [Vibrio harveyi]|uniref:hypothetical protein n=1 Tax=Vibrio harveyi TaxID=669 RepID=UPI00234CA93F|nr:hypothetical protein [Vibrio harveyi]WCP84201.1 hypothetical protein PQE20_27370 [Vibrio harveyi]